VLDPTEVGFEKVGFEKKGAKSQKSDSRKVRSGIQKRCIRKVACEQNWIRTKLDSRKIRFEQVGSWIRKSWIPKVGFAKSWAGLGIQKVGFDKSWAGLGQVKLSQVEFIFESGIEIKIQGSSGTNKLVPTHPHKICVRYDPSIYIYIYIYIKGARGQTESTGSFLPGLPLIPTRPKSHDIRMLPSWNPPSMEIAVYKLNSAVCLLWGCVGSLV